MYVQVRKLSKNDDICALGKGLQDEYSSYTIVETHKNRHHKGT